MLRDGHTANPGWWKPGGDSNSKWVSEGEAKGFPAGDCSSGDGEGCRYQPGM
ncbi:MAG: hypothetical protein LIO92_12095 [Clostridiales bacterium]|nr:hypothetical protein [Clostridiales bacterium]